jgi:hypothetical protein
MADTDILTEDEALEAINMVGSGGSHAIELAMWVSAISEAIDAACGPVVVRTITDEIQYPNGGTFATSHTPLYSVSSLTEYVSGTGTVLTAEDHDTVGTYRIVGSGHDTVIERRSGWGGYAYTGLVKITYVAGRYANTEAVGAKFKLAAASILRRLWTREASAWSRGGDVFGVEPQVGFFKVADPMIKEFLADELLPPAIA